MICISNNINIVFLSVSRKSMYSLQLILFSVCKMLSTAGRKRKLQPQIKGGLKAELT